MPGLRREGNALEAGQGFVISADSRLWRVDDGVMYVNAPAARGPLFVQFHGPSGWLWLTFAGSDDPDFIALWQRWTHPDPRPELAGVSRASGL